MRYVIRKGKIIYKDTFRDKIQYEYETILKPMLMRMKCKYRFRKPTKFEKRMKECMYSFEGDTGLYCRNCGKRIKLKK